jgi:CheY-like chemotaxis protein
MGGSLSVESVVGEGSTFSFSIELDTVQASSAAVSPNRSTRLKGQSVLVVDDNETSRWVLGKQLDAWGMDISEAASGLEATALVESGARFDVALVNMEMPHMTGEELAISLERSRSARPIPLILVSAPRWKLCRTDLFSAVLAKPIMSDRLRDALVVAMWPEGPLHGDRLEARDLANQTRPMRILLVEDNSVNQRVGRLILEKLGHRVDLAANGVESVHAMAVIPYDAVFMDIQMPELNGLDAARRIRSATLPFRQPYIIAVTASATTEDQRECLEAGIDEFLTKPVRIGDFKAALQRAETHATSPSLISR